MMTFYLWNNQIKEKGAKYLPNALEINRTLTTLDIGFNDIAGNGEQNLIDAIQITKTLTTLNSKAILLLIS
ncbi:unnamed protein product [Adineta steineri]|uniref:Uncharacterized protein n=1 Tax=Adineta steineri TaxID=433720 RepID=A0A819SEU5_9BILA|nr:unnamed protein product [Adineta steineri]CAF4058263.1 unnamed protein product [Adineta steineri]